MIANSEKATQPESGSRVLLSRQKRLCLLITCYDESRYQAAELVSDKSCKFDLILNEGYNSVLPLSVA